jgi:hypothetical protein
MRQRFRCIFWATGPSRPSKNRQIPRADLFKDIIVDDEEGFDLAVARCDCHFYRRRRLPGRHLFHHHFVSNSLTFTESLSRKRSIDWEEHGVDIYEAIERYRAPPPPIASSQRDPVDNPYNQVAACEVTETLLC